MVRRMGGGIHPVIFIFGFLLVLVVFFRAQKMLEVQPLDPPNASQNRSSSALKIPLKSIDGKSYEVDWPPKQGESYPDLTLYDQSGSLFALSSLKGKVILLEPIGMSCPACQAFAGAHSSEIGSFGNIVPQADLKSIEEYMGSYAKGASFEDVVYVQLLLYGLDLQAPKPEDAKAWAEHFDMKKERDQIVLVGTPEMVNRYSYNLIPGFQLIDPHFILRSDSTGHHPKENLYTTLLPMLPKILKEKEK